MKIRDDYYNELIKIINNFSEGYFDFNENNLKNLDDGGNKELTEAIINFKNNQNIYIEDTINILDSFIEGNYKNIPIEHINIYSEIYEQYNSFAHQLKKISVNIDNLQTYIIKKGKIKSKIDTSDLKGKWLENAINLNLILDYCANRFDEIIYIINNVAKGNLKEKMKINIDEKKINGDFLYLANTINKMVDQLSQFSSELTRVSDEVGTEGILGGQAKIDHISGTWLDVTNSVNDMAKSLTIQVRNIIKVAEAVANGDLTKEITTDARGEILKLKENINTMIYKLNETNIENKLQNEKLEALSNTDALTGIFNRGYFDKMMPKIIKSCKRNDSLISFAILDLDFFKKVNDTYGHKIGDKVLQHVARVLNDNILRKKDCCFRIGGEEFAVIFSAKTRKKAFDFMNNIREMISDLKIQDDNGNIINRITISIGLTSKRASEIKSLESLFIETDNLLYIAKENGRNMVVQND